MALFQMSLSTLVQVSETIHQSIHLFLRPVLSLSGCLGTRRHASILVASGRKKVGSLSLCMHCMSQDTNEIKSNPVQRGDLCEINISEFPQLKKEIILLFYKHCRPS